MTTNRALIWAAKKLKNISCQGDSPELDAEVLLAAALHSIREALYAHPEEKINKKKFKEFKNLIARRLKHEPVAYILGEKEFFGLKLKVNRSVLIPRPETELLVEEAIMGIRNKELRIRNINIIDVGTGSGAIAVTLAKYLPKIKIIATDISSDALKIARQNAHRHGVAKKIEFIKTDLLPKLKVGEYFLILANLPYLPAHVWKNIMLDVKKFEPKSALLGGTDGLKIIKRLLTKIKKQNIHGMVLLEIDPSQKSKLQKFISKLFPQAVLEIKKDLAGLSRMAIIKI